MNEVTPHAPPPGAARPSRAELRRQKRHGHQGSTLSRPAVDRSVAGDATVCLCMIVRNEAPVIERCLSSVRPLIDRWLVVDTGSTDGTQDLVRKALGDLPGELVERPWRDFAHNRSEALALARPSADYSLIIDADDTIDVPAAFRMPVLDADSYMVDVDDPPIRYRRLQLVRNTLAWCYRGVLHEFLSCDGAGQAGHLPLVMRRRHDGARRRDPTTYRRDAELLERALREEPDPFLRSRYTFYLAQSHRDCGEREQAVARYLERAGLGYWDQEVFVSLYEAAKQMEALGRPDEEVLRTYERATAVCPSRIEAAHGAARLCRNAKAFSRGYAIADAARGRPMPDAGLFVEPWIYAFGLDDELSVLAYWSGHDRDSAEAAERALASPLLPASERGRLEANRRFALDRLAAAKPPAASAAPAAVGWVPARPQGGTELMVEALRGRLGPALDAVDLRVNLYDPATRDARPLVMWFHHDIDQAAVQWCRDRALTDPVARFVFISYWQRERYVSAFGLPPERCVVIKYAMEPAPEPRIWEPAPVFRCAYTSTPFRGLDILLDVWERLPAGRAELHVWSSMKLYTMDDGPYRHLMERAQTMPGVVYHGLAPNAELRAALRTMHFLTYPNTFAETACLSVMEAMSAGCRVIVPSHGVLPETTGGYARIYPWSPDPAVHATTFAEALEQEFAEPWAGRPGEALDEQAHCATIFAWARRLGEWRQLVASLAAAPALPLRAAAVPMPPPPGNDSVTNALLRLRDGGFSPNGIIDVGAHDGAFARIARQVFPAADILMVEALPEKGPVLAGVARDLGNASHTIALLGDRDATATPFFVVDTARRPDLVKTGSSAFRENSAFPMVEMSIPQRRLDGLLEEAGVSCPFIKLDVQGAELSVLRGLSNRLTEVEVIMTEMSLVAYNEGAPLMADVVATLREWGFALLDIVEEHRYRDGRLLQVDGLFARADSPLRPRPPFWT